MRTKFHRLCALALAAALTLGLCVPALAADRATAVRDGAFIKGTFTFGPHEVKNDLTDNYIYSDDYFKGSSYRTNAHLATMSMQMAVSSISSEDADYPNKSQNVQALLNALGFQNVKVNQYYKQEMNTNTMGAAVAYKPLDDNTVLLAIVPRSAGYKREWGGNFNVGRGDSDPQDYYTTNPVGFQGTDGLHAGFQLARNIVLDFVKGYVTEHQSVFDGKTVKVWIAGYSRGAATANLVGAALVDDAQGAIGLKVDSQNIYDYTFGTPLTVLPPKGTTPKAEQYNGIHNYFASYDPVTMAPFSAWGFTRYGQEVTYNAGADGARKARMLRFLNRISPTIYGLYMKGGDPDYFKRYTLGENFELKPLANEALTQQEFLQKRIEIVQKNAATTRDTYVSDYQTVISTLAGFYFGDSRSDQFVQAIMEEENQTKLAQLVLLLAFYDWAEQYQASYADKTASALDKALPAAKETGDPGDYLATEEYEKLRGTLTNAKSLGDYLIKADGQEKSQYIQQAEQLVGELLKTGLDAANVKEDVKEDNELRTSILSDTSIAGLTKFVGYFVFGTETTLEQLTGSEDTSKAIADALIEKINTAATLAGNTGSYMRAHNNEVVLSWLRTMDSYYDDPVAVDDSEPAYAVRAGVVEHGTVNISSRHAERGDRVVLTVTPDAGYELETLTVTDGQGNVLTLTDNRNGKYVFTMPGGGVTVSAVFREIFRETFTGPAYENFSDLKAEAWYRDGVEYALKKGLMRGVSDSVFAPNRTTNRVMAITVLWRAAGSPVVNYAVPFSDVAADSWYAEAAAWAASEGIITGYADGSLGVNDTVTREQLAVMLYRYAQKRGADVSVGEDTNILSYDDAASVAAYAIPAMQWACGSGVINGSASKNGGMVLDPQGSATRAQLAVLLLRFSKEAV